ncbi:hypothetical protein Taro_046298 [Colocasia esculenta]|uniref:Arabinanase/levansucrase/invertase n=1 Tax=Colocasia esculenta TaxID=4460 RepID=A0A843X5Y4_COLES|nr:hypothetical protein [Colocasia esculenta]
MEAIATAAAGRTTMVPRRSSTRRCPAPPHPARSTPSLPALVATGQGAHLRHQATFLMRAESLGRNNIRAPTFLTRCCSRRDAGENSTGSTADSGATSLPTTLVEDPEDLVTVESGAPMSRAPPELAAAGSTLPGQLPTLSSEGLVFRHGTAGAWDGRGVGSPVVKRYLGDDKERWFMWYHGSAEGDGVDDDCSGSIGLALSANGIHWERGTGPVESVDGAGIVMRRCDDWWAFDTLSLRPSDVLIMSSAKVRTTGAVYWLYYTGFTPEKVSIPGNPAATPVPRSLPGLAISQDGRHWARLEGEHHSGALLDVGPPGEWDSLFLAAPRVVYHSRGDMRMYYHALDPANGGYAIGLARSRDGIRWMKLGKALGAGPAGSFDVGGVLNGHVVRRRSGATREEGGYLMVYEGVSADGRRNVGVAESPDGLKGWRRCAGGEAILGPSAEGGWDDGGVGSPCLVQMDGDEGWRLYYRGVGKGGRTGIGLAVSEGSEMGGEFRRWTGFCSLSPSDPANLRAL